VINIYLLTYLLNYTVACSYWTTLAANNIITSVPLRGMAFNVCPYVCHSAHISQKPHVQTHRIFVPDACGRCSVFLWWRYVMLCTSGFTGDAMFSYNGPHRSVLHPCYMLLVASCLRGRRAPRLEKSFVQGFRSEVCDASFPCTWNSIE